MKKHLLKIAGISCCVCSLILILGIFLIWLDCYPKYLAVHDSIQDPGEGFGYGMAGLVFVLVWVLSSFLFFGNAVLDLILGVRILRQKQKTGKRIPGIRSAFFVIADAVSMFFFVLNAFMAEKFHYPLFLVFAIFLFASAVLRVVAAVHAKKTKLRAEGND